MLGSKSTRMSFTWSRTPAQRRLTHHPEDGASSASWTRAQGDSRPQRALVSREVGVPNNGIRIAHCRQTPAVGQGRTRPAQAPRRPAPEPRGAHNGDAAEGQRALGGALSRRRRRDARQDLSDQDAGAPVGAGDGDRRPTRRLDRSTSRPDHVRRVGQRVPHDHRSPEEHHPWRLRAPAPSPHSARLRGLADRSESTG